MIYLLEWKWFMKLMMFLRGGVLLSLHSASSVLELEADARKSHRNNVDFIWCREEYWRILNDKLKTRSYLTEKWIPIVKGGMVSLPERDINLRMKNLWLTFPIIIKETNNTWGQWIYVLESFDDFEKKTLWLYWDYVMEQFLEGSEFSCMVFVCNWNALIFPPIYKWLTGVGEDGQIIHALQKLRSNIVSNKDCFWIQWIIKSLIDIGDFNWFLDFDFIRDHENNFKVLEINPRVSWITDISLMWTDFSISDIISTILCENEFEGMVSILRKKILIEYPIVFTESDFIPKVMNLYGGRILKQTFLRKFPPFTQKVLMEFDNMDDYNDFVENN